MNHDAKFGLPLDGDQESLHPVHGPTVASSVRPGPWTGALGNPSAICAFLALKRGLVQFKRVLRLSRLLLIGRSWLAS